MRCECDHLVMNNFYVTAFTIPSNHGNSGYSGTLLKIPSSSKNLKLFQVCEMIKCLWNIFNNIQESHNETLKLLKCIMNVQGGDIDTRKN